MARNALSDIEGGVYQEESKTQDTKNPLGKDH